MLIRIEVIGKDGGTWKELMTMMLEPIFQRMTAECLLYVLMKILKFNHHIGGVQNLHSAIDP